MADIAEIQQLLLSIPPRLQRVEQLVFSLRSNEKRADELEVELSKLKEAKEKFQQIDRANLTNPRLRKLVKDYEKRVRANVDSSIESARKVLSELKFDSAKKNLFFTKNASGNNKKETSLARSMYSKQESSVGSQLLVQQQILDEEAEREIQREEEEALKVVQEQTQTLKELAQDVSKLADEQQGDIDKIENNAEDASISMIDAVNELAIAKKREARKHTTRGGVVSAVSGGVAGLLIGGPVGAIIGAIGGAGVGATVGGGITAATKASINAELRNLKSARVIQINPLSGAITCRFEIFEQESWSTFSKRGWHTHSPKWSDIYGRPLGNGAPTPDNLINDPKEAVKFVVEGAVKPEQIDELDWKWGKDTWHIDFSRKQTDMHGWDYAYKFSHSGQWYSQMLKSTFVRRRLWIHHVIGTPKKVAQILNKQYTNRIQGSSEKSDESKSLRSELALRYVHSAIKNMDETGEAVMATAEQVEAQGEQIRKGVKNTLLVDDTSEHAERIRRAANLSGVIRNFLTFPAHQSVQFSKEELLKESVEEMPLPSDSTDDPLNILSQQCTTQFSISKSMSKALEIQNEHLGILESATEKNQRNVKKLHDRLF